MPKHEQHWSLGLQHVTLKLLRVRPFAGSQEGTESGSDFSKPDNRGGVCFMILTWMQGLARDLCTHGTVLLQFRKQPSLQVPSRDLFTKGSSGFGTSASLDMAASMPRAAVPGPGRSAALRTFWRQVAFADQLILSKAEQLGEDEVNHPIQILQKVNPLAEMIVSNDRSIQPLPPPRRTSAPVSAFERLGALPSSWQTIQPAKSLDDIVRQFSEH
eukprot:g23217.t1